MANMNVRARGDGGLGDNLTARRKREEQLGRQRVVIPKQKPAAAAAGSLGSSTATGSHALLSPGDLAFTGWSFAQAFDDVSTGNPTLTAGPGDNDFTIGEAGWYQLGIVKRVAFSSGTPGAVEVRIDLTSIGFEPVWTVPLVSAAENPQPLDHGAMVDVGSRALYLTAGEVVSPRMRWTGGGTMYASALTVFVTRLG